MWLKNRIKAALTVSGWQWRALLVCASMLLFACGGGGSKGKLVSPSSVGASSSSVISSSSALSSSGAASSQSSFTSSSSQVSSVAPSITLGGRVTYDFVPHNNNHIGLDYSATTVKAVRGVVVELIDNKNLVLATTITDNSGDYSFSVESNKLVKVRVKAQLLRDQSPTWNFKVTDNTSSNSLYVMDGGLIAASDSTGVRNLHAASGWSGTGYSSTRVAAPFAILDSVLVGAERILAAGNSRNFPALELRWSVNNKAAEGEPTLGEVGTSFYDGSAIYVLGDQNGDTDEYDRHVILHEWGHYVESEFSRSDNIGGDHAYDDKLDFRVAMSEGFANAFSAMMLDDPEYRDASGAQQADGFSNDVSRKNHIVRGWYSESSIQSILYNFYLSENGRVGKNFSDIFNIFSSQTYSENVAMISIYTFTDALRSVLPSQIANFESLLFEQNIEPTNAFGEGESNSGGYSGSLPVYKILPTNNSSTNVCSTNRFGAYNKLSASQFLRLNVTSPGAYQISVQEAGGNSGNSDPDIYLYKSGDLIDFAEGAAIDQESLSTSLTAGTYVLELVDARIIDLNTSDLITACFDVRASVSN